jgi:hypothetical protein
MRHRGWRGPRQLLVIAALVYMVGFAVGGTLAQLGWHPTALLRLQWYLLLRGTTAPHGSKPGRQVCGFAWSSNHHPGGEMSLNFELMWLIDT